MCGVGPASSAEGWGRCQSPGEEPPVLWSGAGTWEELKFSPLMVKKGKRRSCLGQRKVFWGAPAEMGSLGYKSDQSVGFAFCAAKSGFRSGVALQTVPNYKLGTPLVLILLISHPCFFSFNHFWSAGGTRVCTHKHWGSGVTPLRSTGCVNTGKIVSWYHHMQLLSPKCIIHLWLNSP